MTLNINQFAQTVVQGVMALLSPKNVISCEVDTTESGTLVAGQAVKLVDSAGGVPKVIAATVNTDRIYGFVVYQPRKATFAAFDALEIATGHDDYMWMTAGAAIARGALVMPVISGAKVITATSGKPISGYAYDKAAADGDLIRVSIQCPAYFVV